MRLGQSDMTFEAKRFCPIVVAIPELRVCRGIAVCPCQQRNPQPQQRNLGNSTNPGSVGSAANRSIAARASLRSALVPRLAAAVIPAKDPGGLAKGDHVARVERVVDDRACQAGWRRRYRRFWLSPSRSRCRQSATDGDFRVPMQQGSFAILGEQREARRALQNRPD